MNQDVQEAIRNVVVICVAFVCGVVAGSARAQSIETGVPASTCVTGGADHCTDRSFVDPDDIKVCNDGDQIEQRVRVIDCKSGRPISSLYLRRGECAECSSKDGCCLALEVKAPGNDLFACRNYLGAENYAQTCRIDEDTISLRLKVAQPEQR